MFGKQKKDSLLPPRYKYIKDYDLQTRLDTRGRERQTAVYKGPYFLPLHSDETFRMYRISVIAAAVLILGAAFVLLFFDRYTVYRHEGLYTLIPLTVALFPFAYMLLGFFRMPRKNERMQRDVYARSIRRIHRSSAGIAIFAGLSLILWLVYLIITRFTDLTAWDALFTGMMLLILACALFLFFFDRKLKFEVEPGEAPHELQDAMNARGGE